MHGVEKRIVYVIRSDRNPSRHYIGLTNDVSARLEWHNHGPSGVGPPVVADRYPRIRRAGDCSAVRKVPSRAARAGHSRSGTSRSPGSMKSVDTGNRSRSPLSVRIQPEEPSHTLRKDTWDASAHVSLRLLSESSNVTCRALIPGKPYSAGVRILGLEPTCWYQKPSARRSSLRRYSFCPDLRARLPVTTTKSPGLNVLAVKPIETSSLRLSISSCHRCASPLRPLTSMIRNGCGLTS